MWENMKGTDKNGVSVPFRRLGCGENYAADRRIPDTLYKER